MRMLVCQWNQFLVREKSSRTKDEQRMHRVTYIRVAKMKSSNGECQIEYERQFGCCTSNSQFVVSSRCHSTAHTHTLCSAAQRLIVTDTHTHSHWNRIQMTECECEMDTSEHAYASCKNKIMAHSWFFKWQAQHHTNSFAHTNTNARSHTQNMLNGNECCGNGKQRKCDANVDGVDDVVVVDKVVCMLRTVAGHQVDSVSWNFHANENKFARPICRYVCIRH